MSGEEPKRSHIILVHGNGHGAWCWYKLAPLLRSAGHRVTAIGLAASGIHPKTLDEIRRFADYAQPLIDVIGSLSPDEQVILIGHSYGGLPLAMAMESFPKNIVVAVFVTAVMPGITTPFSALAQEFFIWCPPESFMDCEIRQSQGPESPLTSISYGANYISKKMYQLCSPQDQTLATMLIRPGSWFLEDPTMNSLVTEKNYGSVARAFIICKEDIAMTEGYQRWMVDRSTGTDVEEIDGADHMVMLSKPQELCDVLLKIIKKHE